MKKLSVEEQKKVIGGYDNHMCGRVQQWANQLAACEQADTHENGDLYDLMWDLWTEEFDKYCL